MNTIHIIVDMLYDFIDGSLACQNADNAVKESVKYINSHPNQPVLYVCDCHPANHCSFKEFGGIWPAHCVNGTRGAAIHEAYNGVGNERNRPNEENMFLKGCNSAQEEYSGYSAVNLSGKGISNICTAINPHKEVVISGIATEFCIRETVMDLLENGFKVTLLKDALGYVNHEGHLNTLKEIGRAGANIV